ncbi:MAG: hypothetical protein FJY29_06660 [Betaproteobacteria bacterium]|nr:hypothetical protein [Betaproteobacteria bacterium]
MILRLLAFFSSILHLPLRAFSYTPAGWLSSEKTKIFLHERRQAFLRLKVSEAGQVLHNMSAAQSSSIPNIYWIHVASAGELEQAIPVLRALHEQHQIFFFLTYFSPSARSFVKNCPGLLAATSLPAEDGFAYSMIIKDLKIRRILLVRYDFWPALMFAAEKAQTPVAVLAATLNKARSPLPSFLQKRLRCFWFECTDLIFLVSGKDRQELISLNVTPEKLHVAGDAKWLRAKERASQAKNDNLNSALKKLSTLFNSSAQRSFERVIVFGSPHEEELRTLELCLNQFLDNDLVIVAPAEVDEHSVRQLQSRLQKTGAKIVLLSGETRETLHTLAHGGDSKRVLILDGFGYLAEAYRYADLAIIGGGFDGQLHNVLEPVAYPILTLYGDQFERAPEARLVLDRKAAIGFANPNELFQFLLRWSSVKKLGEEDLGWSQNLQKTLENAQELFGSLPDTSEVVCRTLAAQDKLETT